MFRSSMFHYSLKSLIFHKPSHCALTVFRCIETKSASIKPNLSGRQSPTVSYLIDSCGLSLESAIKASKLVEIKNKKRSDSVLELVRSYGFSKNDISEVISKRPRVLSADPVKNLRPRIEFFESLGIARPDLPGTFIWCMFLLNRSLDKVIKPTFDFLKCYIDTNENPVRTLRVLNVLVANDLKRSILPNVETLRNHNMPKTQIGKILSWHPNSVVGRAAILKEVVTAVSEMGIDPKSQKFISAVVAMTKMNKPMWERKKETLLRLGWTKSDFDLAFSLQPMLMGNSEKKMREMMDFFVNKIGLKASDVARCPNVLLTSLEKRVIPRWSILQILTSKGLLNKNSNFIWKFNESKKVFEKSVVHKFKDKIPELVKAYENQISSKASKDAHKGIY